MRSLLLTGVLAAAVLGAAGCSRPSMPSLNGPGMLHDITQVRRGMSPNEVERVLGAGHKNIFEEGIQGVDGGHYVWEYPQGRVYFDMSGVTRVQPF